MLKRDWLFPDAIPLPPGLLEVCGGDVRLADLLRRRGVSDADAARAFLNPLAYSPSPPDDLPDMDEAVARLMRALHQGERICVWGDFDVDGQTSTALLVSLLRSLNADVCHHIPIRAIESHGMTIPALRQEIEAGAQLILTCDTGISAHEAVEFAGSLGVDVIITDHHDLPVELPPAAAILNPKRLPGMHPLHQLPGVGCAYKLAEAMLAATGDSDQAGAYLDLVALGIVADVAVLSGDVRYLLQVGLEALRTTHREGLLALFRLVRLTPETLNEGDIGFSIAPRLNALGRLEDANVAVEFLTTKDPARAHQLASHLDALNAKRRMLVDHVTAAAEERLNRNPDLLDEGALVLEAAGWPGGVIGIVASKLVEQYHMPVILLSVGKDGLARGSARSIDGVDISAAIASQAGLLMSYGGHPMAAGLSLAVEKIPVFRKRLGQVVSVARAELPLVPPLQVDGVLPWSSLSMDLAGRISRLAPFGAGNPVPVFVSENVHVVEQRTLGQDGRHLKLSFSDEAGNVHDVLWWNSAGEIVPQDAIDVAYTLQLHTFRGEPQIQLEWVDARVHDLKPAELSPSKTFELVDLRLSTAPQIEVARYREAGAEVWAEGEHRTDGIGKGRHELKNAETLVIWTSPPGPDALADVLQRLVPKRVVLVGQPPQAQSMEAFLTRLAGAIKRVLSSRDGRIALEHLAAVCATTEGLVELGLRWQEAKGFISFTIGGGGQVILQAGVGQPREEIETLEAALRTHLREMRAYRNYVRRAPADRLIIGD